MQAIRGGTIVYWAAPRWRRALYRLGVKRHHARLGDVKRAEQLEAVSRNRRLRELFFATEHHSIPLRFTLQSLPAQRPGLYHWDKRRAGT